MDTKQRKAAASEFLATAAVVAALMLVILAWRTFVGQDNGVVRLISSLF